ncbi:hypothetical protein HPB48_011415 [Haemaphysalis longicornis]|uniref:Uncharacterized protein n=1 Tax=Haemaphysalis longicornis TaxID=44386 RepID=A0A9J6FQL8_HAELO|nr:hypothetical protein HPB48_011415 [Haemaphysalis longicornis]
MEVGRAATDRLRLPLPASARRLCHGGSRGGSRNNMKTALPGFLHATAAAIAVPYRTVVQPRKTPPGIRRLAAVRPRLHPKSEVSPTP